MSIRPPGNHALSLALLALSPAFTPGVVRAQTAGAPTVTTLPSMEVREEKPATVGYQPKRSSLATGTDAPLLDVPQIVNVVPQQVLRDRAVKTLDEALYNVSGITQANTLGNTQDAFIRRGFGDNRDGSIMRDGLRTALPRSFTAGADRVEVLKGPSSMLYGILDPGGLINVVSKTPEWDQRGEATLSGTSFGGGGGAIDLTGPLPNSPLAYRLVADYQNANYWRNFGNSLTNLLAGSLAWKGEKTTINFGVEYSDYRVPFDRGTIIDPRTAKPVNTPRERRFDEPYNVTRGASLLTNLGITHEISDKWKASLGYAYSQNHYRDNQARVTAYNSALNGVVTRRADATQGSNIDVHALRFDVVGKGDVAGLQHELLTGVSYDYSNTYRSNLIRSATSTAFNIFNPVYNALGASTAVSAAESDQTERIDTSSLYIQDSVKLGQDWILVGGVRYQYYSQFAGRGRPFITNTNRSEGKALPRAGLVYKLTPALSLFASYSESFRPNSNIASFIGSQPPETGVSYEVGAKAELGRGVTASLSLYDINKKNVLYNETIGGTVFTRTAGEVSSRGLEADIAGEIVKDWSLIGSYAFTAAKVENDPVNRGKQLANVAKHTASLFVTHDFGALLRSDGIRAGFGGRYVGERPGDAGNSFFMDSYVVFDSFVSYRTTWDGLPLTVQLNLKNMFDKTYYPSAVNNLGVAIGEPFQAVVQAKIEF